MKEIRVGSLVCAVFGQAWLMYAVALFCTEHWAGGVVATLLGLANIFHA